MNMKSMVIRPFNVTDKTELPELSVNQMPTDGDPLEIKGEMYFVCETSDEKQAGPVEIGVIPLVVRNPAKIQNIDTYLKCLSIAHRRVQFKNKKGNCDLNDCDEMVIG
jgi:hypothetical protein